MQVEREQSKTVIVSVRDDAMSGDRIMMGDLVVVDEEACFTRLRQL